MIYGMETIFRFFSALGNEAALFIISMIPLIEERGAIVYGAAIGMPWYKVLPICIIANMLPVPFVLIFGMKLIELLKKSRILGGFFTRYEEKLKKKSETVDKYSFMALVLLVGLPIPGTGAWSGSLVATILQVEKKRAIPALFVGVVMCGIIVTLAAYGVVGAFRMFL